MKTMKTKKILVGLATFLFAMAFVFSSCDRDTAVTGVELVDRTDQPVRLVIGESDELVAQVIPSDATNRNVTWYSDNTAVVTVSEGVVNAVGAGNARVTVTTQDGNFQAYVNYVVVDLRIPVDGVTIDSVTRTGTTERIEFVMDEDIKTISILHGSFITFHETVSPEDTEEGAVARGVTWTSRNPAYVTIGATTGAVTSTGLGTTYVVVTTTEGGFQDSVRVTVEPIRVENVEIQLGGNAVTEHEMRIHHVRTFTVVLNPAPSFPSVAWTIEHISGTEGEVVTMENGVVTGVGEGSVYLIATATENGLGQNYARVEITVSGVAASGVTLNETEVELTVPNTFTLVATVTPDEATDQTVTWTSSNTNIVAVVDGVLTARNPGTATITATTNDGGYEATATVNVLEGPPAQCVLNLLEGLITPETVSFRTENYWDIGNLRWSDVVIADICVGRAYYAEVDFELHGLTASTFASDCRNGVVTAEDLSFFSWCAVMTYRDILCPDGWRVPTAADFAHLVHTMNADGTFSQLVPGGSGSIMGSAGSANHPPPFVPSNEARDFVRRFWTEWGGENVGGFTQNAARGFGHMWSGPGVAVSQGNSTRYWGSTVLNATNAANLFLGDSQATPEAPRGELRLNLTGNPGIKHSGGLLRCVKDN